MDNGVGSSVVIVIAAALWFIYLVPTWLRRRQYLATERNAVRLQQTLRILAETAEVPAQVRAEASARNIAQQQRALKDQQQLAAAARRTQAAAAARAARVAGTSSNPGLPSLGASRTERMAANRAILPRPVSSRRLRRSRLLASVVLFTALIASGFGVVSAIVTPAAFGSWLLLAGGLTISVGAFVLLGQMAAVSRARIELSRLAPAAESAWMSEPRLPRTVPATAWTPVPVPKPLYLSRSQAPVSLADGTGSFVPAAAQAGFRAELLKADLLRAAAESDAALRAVPQPPVIRAAVASAAPVPSRFARMGLVEESDAALTDLDAVLRRRRAVG